MAPRSGRPGEAERLGTRPAAGPRYEILGEAGRGGMGRVLRVRDRTLGRELAMKVVDPGEVAAEELERFREEARLTSQLDHPGIVGVHDVGELEDGRVFYTMPLVDGRTLDEVMAKARRAAEGWSRTRVLHVLLKACEAVAYAHERGVVHRDLKPANLMVGRHGEVLVLDWGLARRRDRPGADAAGGSPATMAPEVLSGREPAGRRADVYAFGAILYALCTGHLPYEDAPPERALERILRGPPTPIAALAPTTPADLAAIAEKAMARDPRERYATVDALRADLERFAEGRIVAAHPVGRVARARKWARRHPQLAASLAVAAVLLLALFLVQAEKVRTVARANAATTRRAYVANLSAAEAGLRMNEAAEARRRLAACDPALRGWEWRHLARKADSAARAFIAAAPGGEVDAVAAAADGTIATGSGTTVALWDAAGTRRASADLGAAVISLAFSADGGTLAVGSADGVVARLDAHDLTERSRARRFETAVDALASAPGGDTVAACSTNANRVVVERPGHPPLEATLPGPTSLAFVDERVLAVGTVEPFLALLDARDLREVARLPLPPAPSLAARPGGGLLAAGGLDGRVRLVDVSDAAAPTVARAIDAHAGLVGAVAWSADGATLASGSDDTTVRLWTAPGGLRLAPGLGHADRVESLTALPEGSFGGGFASGSADGTVRVWRAAEAAELVLPGHAQWVEDVTFLGAGERVATADWAARIRIWDAVDGALERELPLDDRATAVAASADGARLARAAGTGVAVVDVGSGRVLRAHDLGGAHALALAWRGAELLARTSDGELVALGPDEAPPRRLAAGLDLTRALAVASDGRRVAFGTADGRVLVVDADSGATLRELATPGGAAALAFDPAGERLLVGRRDGATRLHALAGDAPPLLLEGHGDDVTDVAFTPDGARQITASQDGTVRVWDGAELLLTLRGHGDWVTALDVAAGGDAIASASRDGTVRLWRAPRRP